MTKAVAEKKKLKMKEIQEGSEKLNSLLVEKKNRVNQMRKEIEKENKVKMDLQEKQRQKELSMKEQERRA